MLILSKKRDYYDNIRAYGIDKSIIYDRKEETINFKHKYHRLCSKTVDPLDECPHSWEYNKHQFSFFVVGFCGKVYPVIRVERYRTHMTIGLKDLQSTEHFFFASDVLDYCNRYNIKVPEKDWNDTVRTVRGIKRFFNEGYDFLYPLFQKYKVPVFVWGCTQDKYSWYTNPTLILNPILKDYQFMRMIPPPLAFQELMMYISGVLGTPDRPMVKLSDKEIARKHQMDGKYSFRKTPKS
jgi:hypothetical protein